MTRTGTQEALPTTARRLIAACAVACALLPAAPAAARLGDLDTGFDADGVAVPAVGGGASRLEALAVRPDGRLVTAGWATDGAGNQESLVVALTAAGAPDTTFNGTGVQRIDTSTPQPYYAVALDGAGRTIAAGMRAAATTAPPIVNAARYTATGGRDGSFSGFLTVGGEAHGVAPQADGTTYLGGWQAGPPDQFLLARLTTGGALDTTFSGDGLAQASFGSTARAFAMAQAPDGDFILAGWHDVGALTSLHQPALARFNSDGTLDGNFGTGGILTFGGTNPDGNAVGEFNAVTVASDGTITAAGSSGRFGLVLRLTGTGLPVGFGAKYQTLGNQVTWHGVALDGARTFLAGVTASPDQLLLGGLDAAGPPSAGLGLRSFGAPANGTARGLALAPDGGLLTAGNLAGDAPFVSRHLPNAAPAAALAAPAQVVAGAPVTLDAGASTDPEGEPLTYAFDLDGDGSYEFAGGDNPLAFRSYGAPGSFTVGVRVTDPEGAAATATRTIAVTSAPAPVPQPVLHKQGVAQPLKGKIRYRLPGTKQFLPLVDLTAIPNGTEIDARNGRVLLTVLHDASGALDGARFYAGRFIFKQGGGTTPITTLRLTGGTYKGCPRPGAKPAARTLAMVASAARDGSSTVRRLWGNGRGRFRTRGRYGAATVRGTKWLTRDQCNGTLVKVVRGKVDVTDLVRPKRKPVRVTAGEKVLIKAKRRG